MLSYIFIKFVLFCYTYTIISTTLRIKHEQHAFKKRRQYALIDYITQTECCHCKFYFHDKWCELYAHNHSVIVMHGLTCCNMEKGARQRCTDGAKEIYV